MSHDTETTLQENKKQILENVCNMELAFQDNIRINQAIRFATERHEKQFRKGTTIPYILHPLETLQILSEMHADVNVQIAGILHDLLEDTDTTEEEITAQFGSDISSLVRQHSEEKEKNWYERKASAIVAAKTADQRVKMLILADKLSNLRAIARDYEVLGDTLWQRFNAPKEKQAWYYSGMLDALADLQDYTETANVYLELTEHYKDVFVIYKITPEYDKLYQANTFGEAYCLTKGNPKWEPINYRFRQNDILLTRKEAESIEDKWYDLFLNTIEQDLQDHIYPLFTNDEQNTFLELAQYQLIFHNDQNNIVLNEDDTYTFLSQLRTTHGIQISLEQILQQTFGNVNGAALFQFTCEQLGIEF